MAIAIWSSRFETGIGVVDAQHRSLFEAVNRLADSFQEGRSREQARECLDFLANYTREHFETEEQFMREANFPGLADHQADHAYLLDRVRELQAAEGSSQSLGIEVSIFLADWLKQHISEVDMMYVDFMKGFSQT